MNDHTLFKQLLKDGASFYGISLDDTALSDFEQYTDLLNVWNKRANLVSSRDMNRFVEYHLLDSLKVASCFNIKTVQSLLDFGAGAGLPGIPLAIAFPHILSTLVDSRRKRCFFLDDIVKQLSLTNVTVVHSSIERIPDTYNESFDVVITRATTSLEQFFLLTYRFISRGGSLIAIKGQKIKDELQALTKHVDPKVFHIQLTFPKAFNHVRQGTVVTITHY